MRVAASAMPLSSRRATARARASRSPISSSCWRIVSTSCSPTVISGFRLVCGSWKIIEMRLPRSACSAASRSSPSMRLPPSVTLPARRIRPVPGRSPVHGRPDRRLARPGLADQPDDLAGAHAMLTPSTASDRRSASGSHEARHANFGVRPSRISSNAGGTDRVDLRSIAASDRTRRGGSPRARSRRRSAPRGSALGNSTIHHSPENRYSVPIRISVPSEGWFGGTPTPRNDSVASSSTATARSIVRITRIGPRMFGRMCTTRMRTGCTPMTSAACTYSFCRSTNVDARAVRAKLTHSDKPDRDGQHDQHQVVVGLARQDAAGDAVDEQRGQDRRQRELDVGDAHDDRVDPSAEVTRDEPERHPEQAREGDRGEPDEQGEPRAVEDRRQEIPPLVVGADREARVARLRPRRRQQGIEQIDRRDVVGIERGDQRGERRRPDARAPRSTAATIASGLCRNR